MVDLDKVKIIRGRRRTMTLNILPDGTIQVKAPTLMPKFFINDFVRKNSEWIDKRIQKLSHIVPKKRQFIEGDKFLFLGKHYELALGNYNAIEIKDDKLLFPLGLKFRAKKELENWYIKQAKGYIKAQAEHYSKEMRTEYRSIAFSDTRSKWGSCTHDNRLQFNWRLIMAPVLVLRYVVIHELAHTIEKNHSHSFWARVRAQNPSFKEQIKWLKNNGDGLVI